MNRIAIKKALASSFVSRVIIGDGYVFVVYQDGATTRFNVGVFDYSFDDIREFLTENGYVHYGSDTQWRRSQQVTTRTFADNNELHIAVVLRRQAFGEYECPYCGFWETDGTELTWHIEHAHSGKTYPLPSDVKEWADKETEGTVLPPISVGRVVFIIDGVDILSETIAVMREAVHDDSLWYTEERKNLVITNAEERGWVRRPSTTQVEWTELGASIAKGESHEES